MLCSFVLLSYNQSKSIIHSLNSIRYALPNNDYEIILCDNNSIDDIEQIFNNYCDKYNIRHFFVNNPIQKNQSRSRNLGMDNSNGKYILFMDSDDYYNVVELKKLYNYMNTHTNDIILPNVVTQDRTNKLLYKKRNINEISDPCIATCQYIVLNDFIIKNNIRWEETKYYWDSEDVYFGMLLFSKTNDIVKCNYNYYIHPKHDGSNSDRRDYHKYFNYVLYMSNMYADIIKFSNNKFYNNILKAVLLNICSELKYLKGCER